MKRETCGGQEKGQFRVGKRKNKWVRKKTQTPSKKRHTVVQFVNPAKGGGGKPAGLVKKKE